MKYFAKLFISFFLIGVHSAVYDFSYSSPNFRDRKGINPRILVLHYTTSCNDNAVNWMCDKKSQASAHYLVGNAGTIFRLVDEKYSAFHAGVSYWNGIKNINDHSIGIEITNFGYTRDESFKYFSEKEIEKCAYACEKKWHPYNACQIDSIISVCKEIIFRYDIKPHNIVGHSDVALGRKFDPGPVFPWKMIHDHGIGAWPDMETSLNKVEIPSSISVSWVQNYLHKYGYDCPLNGKADSKTGDAIKAFQMHFDPYTKNFGIPDEMFCEKLARLIDQYIVE
ncbi:N-acetylmuramoyl-L-alanine amidase [Candidatus Cytomitobacter indipagum]|nr:N-acetylmuramoyl-L-alanine amidase [Candidatus Cytomitobacter indipagum]